MNTYIMNTSSHHITQVSSELVVYPVIACNSQFSCSATRLLGLYMYTTMAGFFFFLITEVPLRTSLHVHVYIFLYFCRKASEVGLWDHL